MPATDKLSQDTPLPRQPSTVVGVAWYRPEQWEKLRKISLDRSDLEKTHAEWLAIVAEKLLDFKQMGITPRPVEVDVDELAHWCKQHQRPVDAAARSEFVAVKLTEAGEEGAEYSATTP